MERSLGELSIDELDFPGVYSAGFVSYGGSWHQIDHLLCPAVV